MNTAPIIKKKGNRKMLYVDEKKCQDELARMYFRQITEKVRYMYPVRFITCGGCGKPFYTQVKCKKYCSFDCMRLGSLKIAARRTKENRENRICECCGKVFTPTRSDGKFCSNACRQKAYRKTHGVTDKSSGQNDHLIYP